MCEETKEESEACHVSGRFGTRVVCESQEKKCLHNIAGDAVGSGWNTVSEQ